MPRSRIDWHPDAFADWTELGCGFMNGYIPIFPAEGDGCREAANSAADDDDSRHSDMILTFNVKRAFKNGDCGNCLSSQREQWGATHRLRAIGLCEVAVACTLDTELTDSLNQRRGVS